MMNVLGDVNVVAIAFACLIGVLIVVLPLLRDRGAISLIVWPAFGMAQILVGHAMLDQILEGSFWWAYALSAIAVIAGYYLVTPRYATAHQLAMHAPREQLLARKTLVAFAGVISFFVAYHFIVGGVPLLSADVELARFNFSGSGLFGIPGRMYLFGLPFLVTYASYVAARDPDANVLRLRNLLWGEYAFAMILGLVVLITGFVWRDLILQMLGWH